MSERIYLWQGNYYCEGDIVGSLTENHPWSAWVERGGDPDRGDPEELLASIAAYFSLDPHSPADIADNNFPLRLRQPPEPPSFCCVCMRWFTVT